MLIDTARLTHSPRLEESSTVPCVLEMMEQKENKKGRLSFSLQAVHPPGPGGPTTHFIEDIERGVVGPLTDLNSSTALFFLNVSAVR